MSKKERLLLAATAAAALVLRAVAFFRYRFDSDEQQHLHVTWGWTAGLLPYRDIFDNHAPLFHLITAPFLALVGERSDVLLWMRLPMLPLFALSLWATYAIGRELYDERVGRWATVLVALFPPFFLKTLEFRTDNLWIAIWLAVLVLLVRKRSPFLIGLLLGAALATSLKTMPMLAALGFAIGLAVWFARPLNPRLPLPSRRDAAKLLGGFVIVPALFLIGFAAAGMWNDLVYCTLTFNSRLVETKADTWVGRLIFPFALGAVLYAAWRWRGTANSWRYVLALMMALFTVIVTGFWLLISPRDFLPLMPLAAIFAAALIVRARKPELVFGIVVLGLIAGLWKYADRFENRTAWHTTMMDQALRLTRPGEYLIDLKGETIFRPRPTFYAFEYISRSQIAHGILRDTVPEDVIAKRAYVAQADGPMWPPRARAFLSANFLNMGRLRAAGQWIKDDGSFTIAIPGEYVVVVDRGVANGLLDGSPHQGARMLAAGPHYFEGERGAAVMWAPAFRRGHSPFHLRDLDF